MDINEIEMGITSDASIVKNDGNKRMANHSPLRSVSVDGSRLTGDYLYKKPYSYTRQNSINDSREYNDLKDKKETDNVNSRAHIGIHNSTLNKAQTGHRSANLTYSRQISNAIASEKLLEEGNSATSDKKMAENVPLDIEKCQEDPFFKGKRRSRNGRCLYIVTSCSCAISLLAVGLVTVFFFKLSHLSSEQKQEIITSMGFSHHGDISEEVNVSTAGSFKIDQTYLKDHKQIKWLKDEHSEITPSAVDNCLSVKHGGKYLAFSRFTFNIKSEDKITTITHSFKLKTRTGEQKDGGFKRKYVSGLENKLRTSEGIEANRELRKPSVFIEFFDLDAYDQICPNVSNPDLLYVSRMDNDLNIIKV